jgi:hypothetical protein
MDASFVPDVCIGYRGFGDFELYVGTDAAFSLKRPSGVIDLMKRMFHENISPYVGIVYEINDTFSAEAGYTHHFYTFAPSSEAAREIEEDEDVNLGMKKGSNEIYVGVTADVLLSPSLYCFYDFDYRELAIEGKVNYYFDLSNEVLSGLGLDLNAKIGHDRISRPYGIANFPNDQKQYFYYGAGLDLVCNLNEHTKAKIGGAFEGNSAKKDAWLNANRKKNSVWLNASIDCSF